MYRLRLAEGFAHGFNGAWHEWRGFRNIIGTAGTGDDVGQLVQRLDLLGDDPAHGGSLFGRLARQFDGAAAQLLARRLELALYFDGHAAHLGDCGFEAIERLREDLVHFRIGLFVSGAQGCGGAFAFLAARQADLFELLADGAGDRLRRIGQERPDVAGTQLGVAERIFDERLERAHHGFEILGLGIDAGEQRFQRLTARAERRVELGLGASEIGDGSPQRFIMRADLRRNVGRLVHRRGGRPIQHHDLRGDRAERGLELRDPLAERRTRWH